MKAVPPISTLIVDDEPLARRRVRQLVEESAEGFQVVAEAEDGRGAVAAALERRPEVIFLDIQLPDLDGFEVLDALESAESYAPAALVFVTGYDRYAIRAFEANAADYVLKPIDEERFGRTLERVRQRLRGKPGTEATRVPRLSALATQLPPERRQIARFIVPHRAGIHIVPVAEVEYLTASDNYVTIGTAGRRHLIRARLSELVQRLDPAAFVRVHRSHVVAIRHIQSVRARPRGKYQILLTSGSMVQVSRTYRRELGPVLTRLSLTPAE